jgi:hypothetical protein
VAPDFHDLDMSEAEIAIYNKIDGRLNVRELTGTSDLTEFEVTRILFQLLLARLIEPVRRRSSSAGVPRRRRLAGAVEGDLDLQRHVRAFVRIAEKTVGEDQAARSSGPSCRTPRRTGSGPACSSINTAASAEHAHREHLRAPVRKRKMVLDEGLNTLLSVQLFEVSQHLDSAGKVDVFRFISDQKASLEKATA